jgi:hypothetical protein
MGSQGTTIRINPPALVDRLAVVKREPGDHSNQMTINWQPGECAVDCAQITIAEASRRSERRCSRRQLPSACHGCAVACSGQPPPPSAPEPMWGWRAWLLSRGCGGLAFARVDGNGESIKCPRAAARPAGHSGVNLVVLLISFQCRRLISLLGVNPLRCSHSDRFLVHLNC